MHTFIAECGRERAAVQYLDVNDEMLISKYLHELVIEDAKLLYSQDAEWHNKHQLAAQNKSVRVLVGLATKYRESFTANFAVADALKDLGHYSISANLFKRAFHAANHAGLKFRAKCKEALSLKLLAGACMDAGKHEFAVNVAVDACRAFEKARKFSYSATAVNAVTLECGASLLYCSIVSLAVDLEKLNGRQCEKQSLERILHLARIHHHLSATLTRFYGISLISAELENIEHSIDAIESWVNEL